VPLSGPLILAFDTSAARCAAVLLSGDRVLAARHEAMARGQAERLMPLLAEVLAEAGVAAHALAALGVGTGPGNFTGTRIAVAAARGLSLSLGIPAVGVSGLEALAHAGPRPALACLDARAGRLYVQGFGCPPDTPRLMALDALDALDAGDAGDLPRGAACLGDHAEALAAATGGTVRTPAMPVAEAIARCAAARHRAADLPRPAPLYLRAADAAAPADAPVVLLP